MWAQELSLFQHIVSFLFMKMETFLADKLIQCVEMCHNTNLICESVVAKVTITHTHSDTNRNPGRGLPSEKKKTLVPSCRT